MSETTDLSGHLTGHVTGHVKCSIITLTGFDHVTHHVTIQVQAMSSETCLKQSKYQPNDRTSRDRSRDKFDHHTDRCRSRDVTWLWKSCSGHVTRHVICHVTRHVPVIFLLKRTPFTLLRVSCQHARSSYGLCSGIAGNIADFLQVHNGTGM